MAVPCERQPVTVPESALCSEFTSASPDWSFLVTVFITSSPRSSDCTSSILALMSATRKLLPRAPVTVVFDGPHPAVSNNMSAEASRSLAQLKLLHGNATRIRQSYEAKIAAVRTHPSVASRVVVHSRWLHKGGALLSAMATTKRTPILFVVEEDVELIDVRTIQTTMIIEQLLCDSSRVEFVQLYWGDSLDVATFGTPTYEAHPWQPGLLRVHRWSDRPHFALASLYDRVVIPFFTRNQRSTIESELISRFQHGQTYSRYVRSASYTLKMDSNSHASLNPWPCPLLRSGSSIRVRMD